MPGGGMEPEPEPETGYKAGYEVWSMFWAAGGKVDGERQTEVQDYRNTITIIMTMMISHKKLPVTD
jgi:hypothetical protein